MNPPFFTVIIATYNRASTLRRAIDSALAQDHAPSFEVIVVDDGSKDSTPEVLASYGPHIQVITQANAGPAIARNRAIEQAQGRYVCFLDSDDLWFPWTLATYHRVIEENGQPSFVVAAMHETTEEGLAGSPQDPAPLRFESAGCYFDHLREFYMIGCPVMVLRRDVLVEAGSFPEVRLNCEDSDLCIRLGEASGFIRIQSPATVAYVRHENSLTFQGIEKTATGVFHMLSQERAGRYPGGTKRAALRSMLLATHARSCAIGLAHRRLFKLAVCIYFLSLFHNVRDLRFKFILCVPFWLASRTIRSGME